MRVAIVGTGYVGLVTGACLADAGHQVTCVDVDPTRVAAIEAGRSFLHEPGLQDILHRHAGRSLRGSTDLAAAVRASDLTMIAVGTPTYEGRIDLRFVTTAAGQIADALRGHVAPHVVVVKSTVVPGTTEDVVAPILHAGRDADERKLIGVAMNPEFLAEGTAVADFANPDRIVIGAADALAEERLRSLYAPFERASVLVTTPRTAEAIKYAANAVLATLISFSNEIGNLAATMPGVDAQTVMQGVHLDRRWSTRLADGTIVRPGVLAFLAPGCGFGGSCFPKDLAALSTFGHTAGVPTPVLDAVLAVNAAQPDRIVALLDDELGGLDGRRVALLGIAFKPGTDDVRESPTLTLVDRLLAHGAVLRAYDPVAHASGRAALPEDCDVVPSLDEALDDVDAVVLMTSWPEFQGVPALLAELELQPLVVDGRRMLDPTSVDRYAGIGLGPSASMAT